MKIRNGFVSNSSSSSFCILGVEMSDDRMEDLEGVVGEIGLVFEYGISDYRDSIILGLYPSNMRDDEKLCEFKKRVYEMLSKIDLDGFSVKEEDVDWFTDGGYDG